MKYFIKYTRLQIKKSIHYAPFVFVSSFIICICLVLALGSFVAADAESEERQKLVIGIVGSGEDNLLGLGISAVKSMDTSRFSLELAEVSEQEAKTLLGAGKLHAYAVIPEGFIEDAFNGIVGKIDYITNPGASGVAQVFQAEILEMISSVLIESQKGMYGMQNMLREQNAANYSAHANLLLSRYFSLILNRASVMDVEEKGVSDGLSFSGYLLCGIFTALLMFCGIGALPLLCEKNISFLGSMRSKGIGSTVQTVGEYLAYFLLFFLNCALICTVFSIGGKEVFGFVPELAGKNINMLILLFKLFPPLLAISALQFFLYRITDSVVGSMLLQFAAAAGLSYISGCFYPISFFPDAVRATASFTPSGMAREYISSLLSGKDGAILGICLVLYAVLLVLGAALLRERRICKG